MSWVAIAGFWFHCHAIGDTNDFPEFNPKTAQTYLTSVADLIQNQVGVGVETYFLQARLQSYLGHSEDAERLAKLAFDRDPKRADIPSFLADLFIREDRLEEAARCLRNALALEPTIAGGYRRLGMVLDRLGDRPAARTAFNAAIEAAPDDATARLLLGRLLLDQGDCQGAVTALERACQLDPTLANAFYVLSQAQSRLGNREAASRARASFQQLKRQEKSAMDAENAAYNDEKAVRTLAAGFHTQAAALFFQRGDPARAEAHLRQALRVAPDDPEAYEALASYLIRNGKLTDARELCEKLVALRPSQAGYQANLGNLLLQLKQFPAAIEHLKRALDLDPKQPEVLNNLARLYLGARRELPQALSWCQRLIELQPTAANYDLLGWALYANGKLTEALAASQQAIERDPNNPVYRERARRLSQAQKKTP